MASSSASGELGVFGAIVGAVRALNFNDAGIVTTRPQSAPAVARNLVAALNEPIAVKIRQVVPPIEI